MQGPPTTPAMTSEGHVDRLVHSVPQTQVTMPRPKRVRTENDFLLFCEFILDYENYQVMQQEEQHEAVASPMGSTKSIAESSQSEESTTVSVPESKSSDSESGSDDDSYDLVTCYCSKPFAGRPMIECSKCSTWIHLSCAKVKKNNIPEVFICAKCKHHRVTRVFNLRHKKRYRYTM